MDNHHLQVYIDKWITVCGRALVFILLISWTQILLNQSQPWIFIDGVNLLVHEAGHIIFLVGGQFSSFLGGTILQATVPSLIGCYFLLKKKIFELFFCIFWLGDNFINISVYIKDARTQTLELVGGGVHDWNTILSHLQILQYDQLIGSIIYFFGLGCIIGSIVYIFLSLVFSIISLTLNRSE